MSPRSEISISAKLGPAEREAAISRLKSREVDVLVIGGGIVGAGAALDAVTRGLSVGLVEARDWASGTSSRSSKLIHGGIRYLEQLDFRLVREALIERGLLLQRLAPHLVKPVRFLYPLTHRFWERLYVGAGMLLYDLFALSGGRTSGVPHHRHLTKRQLQRAIPSLRDGVFTGGLAYYDALVDDARYVSTLVRTASSYGVRAASRVRVEGFIKVGERVVGVTARDLQNGEEFEIRARQIVNATGAWTDDTQALVGERGQFKVRASKGIHLVVPRDRFQSKNGLLLRTATSVLFVIPWGKHWLIGTTDTDWHYDKAHPAATAADIDYLLGQVNRVLSVPLTREDVEGVYAGLRPLLAGESESTSKLSREHIVTHSVPGLVVVAGGKFTTYRVMAKDAIDEAVRALDGRVPRSITEDIPLLGAEGYKAAWNKRGKIARAFGVHKVRIEHLLNRYGTMTDELLQLLHERPELIESLPGADDYIQAEVVYAVTHEGALHLEDVLARRTRISIESWDRGVTAAPVAAHLMAEVLGWDVQREKLEIAHYLKRVRSEVESQEQPTDEAADRARLQAPDISALLAESPKPRKARASGGSAGADALTSTKATRTRSTAKQSDTKQSTTASSGTKRSTTTPSTAKSASNPAKKRTSAKKSGAPDA